MANIGLSIFLPLLLSKTLLYERSATKKYMKESTSTVLSEGLSRKTCVCPISTALTQIQMTPKAAW